MTERLTGAQALIKALESEGVDTVFGVPGGAILPAYDPILDSSIRHVLARHEQGAGHMAEGYALATGRVGVTIATSGPGATNLVTPLQNALMDSVPIVAITGQVATTSIGNDAFQEAFTTGIAMPCTKHAYMVTDADEIGDVVHEAFHLAGTGRFGPVLIDLPKDILNATTSWSAPKPVDLPGYKPTYQGHPMQVKQAIALIQQSEKPVIYAGGGIIAAGANQELLQFAEKARVPVVTTLMARGAFPDHHPLALGMPGMHGVYTAITAMQRADLLIALGTRFDDRVTGDPDTFAPHAQVIHVDVDPAEIGKVRVPEVPIVGDAKAVLRQLLPLLPEISPDREAWFKELRGWQEEHPLQYQQEADGPIKPQFVMEQLFDATGGEAIVVSGVGQHQMWASQYWKFDKPRRWINSGGLGTMGYALPAAIGAKAGMPDELVYAVDGDGCFQMTLQEMITAQSERIPIKIAVFNNGSHGMVRQWQRLFYNERFSGSLLGTGDLDYAAIADAMGCVGLRAERPEEVRPAIEKSLAIDDRPVLVEMKVDPDEMVFPMVPAGGSNDDVITGPEGLS